MVQIFLILIIVSRKLDIYICNTLFFQVLSHVLSYSIPSKSQSRVLFGDIFLGMILSIFFYKKTETT